MFGELKSKVDAESWGICINHRRIGKQNGRIVFRKLGWTVRGALYYRVQEKAKRAIPLKYYKLVQPTLV